MLQAVAAREVLVKYQTIERLAGGKPPAEVTGCVCGAHGVDVLFRACQKHIWQPWHGCSHKKKSHPVRVPGHCRHSPLAQGFGSTKNKSSLEIWCCKIIVTHFLLYICMQMCWFLFPTKRRSCAWARRHGGRDVFCPEYIVRKIPMQDTVFLQHVIETYDVTSQQLSLAKHVSGRALEPVTRVPSSP